MKSYSQLSRYCSWPVAMLAGVCLSLSATATSPLLDAGDTALRHDVQLLADWGVIRSPVTTWPLPAAAVAADVMNDARLSQLSATQMIVVERLRRRLRQAMRQDALRLSGGISFATDEKSLRIYDDTPRDNGVVKVQAEGMGASWAYRARLSYAIDPDDDKHYRADESYAALNWGNWALGAGAQSRWWGPGWEGSLIYSNNARPIPSLFLQRNRSTPFASRWLSWLGHWNLVTTLGQLESDRFIPRALFFSMRVSFKPLAGLEIGLSRSAQFGGKGRSPSLETIGKLLIGDDNADTSGADSDEPGNQLAGYDLRYSFAGHGLPIALYTQFIGEDEANFFPSRYIGQFGIEGWLQAQRGTWRWNLEHSNTVVDFLRDDKGFGSAYSNNVYQTGYRYYGRVIGHGAGGSSEATSLGLRYVRDSGTSAQLVLSSGELQQTANGGGIDFADINLLTKFKYRSANTINLGLSVTRREFDDDEDADVDVVGYIGWEHDL